MKIISNKKNFITSLKIFLPFGYEFFFGYENLITNSDISLDNQIKDSNENNNNN